MIVFNNISLKRGQTELLENATATINPKQKVGLVGKNGCGKSSLFALLKKELTPEGGEVTYPSNWRVSWVNQETPALDIPAIDYVIQGDREYVRSHDHHYAHWLRLIPAANGNISDPLESHNQ